MNERARSRPVSQDKSFSSTIQVSKRNLVPVHPGYVNKLASRSASGSPHSLHNFLKCFDRSANGVVIELHVQ